MKTKLKFGERRYFDYGIVIPDRRGVTYLKPEELKVGYLYEIDARNASYGIWMGIEYGEFLLSRYKFDDNFLFEEIHVDLSNDFGTVKPLKEIEKSPFDMKEYKFSGNIDAEVLEYLNGWIKPWNCAICGKEIYNVDRHIICENCVEGK